MHKDATFFFQFCYAYNISFYFRVTVAIYLRAKGNIANFQNGIAVTSNDQNVMLWRSSTIK